MIEMRRLTPQDSMQARMLWLDAFPEDGDGFCDYYFARLFPQDQYYGLFEQGKLQSMVGVSRQKIHFLGKLLQVGFLRGVATWKSEQGKGYSSRVMEYVLRDLKKQNVPAVALKTYIHSFYRKFGFEVCSYRCWHEVRENSPLTGMEFYDRVEQVPECILEGICACYRDYTADKDFFLERDSAYYRLMLTEALELYDGVLAVHTNEMQRIDGYLVGFAERESGKFRADELVCLETMHPQDFGGVAEKFNCSMLVYKAFDEREQADGMIRILDMAYFLRQKEQGVISEKEQIQVKDPLFTENNGWWQTDMNQPNSQPAKELSPGEAAVWLMESNGRQAGIFEEY